jgi:hypothetical protein
VNNCSPRRITHPLCRVQPRICTTPTHNTHIGISTLPPSILSRRLPCLCRPPSTPIYPANPELEAPHFRDGVSLHNASYNNPSIPQSFNPHKITRNLKVPHERSHKAQCTANSSHLVRNARHRNTRREDPPWHSQLSAFAS